MRKVIDENEDGADSKSSSSMHSFESEEILDTPDHVKKHAYNLDALKNSGYNVELMGVKRDIKSKEV